MLQRVFGRRAFATASSHGFSDAIRAKTMVPPTSPKSVRGVKDYPNIAGTSEIHIFLKPLNPAPELVKKYDAAVAKWNKLNIPHRPGASTVMRPVYLCLNFRNLGDIFVMQSARHIDSDDTEYVVSEAYADGEFFAKEGFEVLRHKIEAFSRTKGVPVTDEEAARYPNRYFEFHLRVNRVDGAPSELISQREVELLRSVSSKLSQQYGVPVPLSYNAYKEGRQRFLNFRVGWCGADTATKACNEIRKAIDASAGVELMHVGKSHSEYVWFDDGRDVDAGWIDFTKQEQEQMFGKLQQQQHA